MGAMSYRKNCKRAARRQNLEAWRKLADRFCRDGFLRANPRQHGDLLTATRRLVARRWLTTNDYYVQLIYTGLRGDPGSTPGPSGWIAPRVDQESRRSYVWPWLGDHPTSSAFTSYIAPTEAR